MNTGAFLSTAVNVQVACNIQASVFWNYRILLSSIPQVLTSLVGTRSPWKFDRTGIHWDSNCAQWWSQMNLVVPTQWWNWNLVKKLWLDLGMPKYFDSLLNAFLPSCSLQVLYKFLKLKKKKFQDWVLMFRWTFRILYCFPIESVV